MVLIRAAIYCLPIAICLAISGAATAQPKDAEPKADANVHYEDREIADANDRGEPEDETSHFNLDNRTDGTPDPSDQVRYYARLECIFDDGRRIQYWRRPQTDKIKLGQFVTIQINDRERYQHHGRVVKFRVSWTRVNRPNGRRVVSDWFEADEGAYVVYAFLLWKQGDVVELDQIEQLPLP